MPDLKLSVAGVGGDNTVIAAVSGKRIRVLQLYMTAQAAETFYWKSGATEIVGDGTNKCAIAASAAHVLPFNRSGWFQTAPGAALILNKTSNIKFGGTLKYELVP